MPVVANEPVLVTSHIIHAVDLGGVEGLDDQIRYVSRHTFLLV
jgi:hypothetical protein